MKKAFLILSFILLMKSGFTQAVISGNNVICPGGSVTLTVTGASAGSGFTWLSSNDNGITWLPVSPGGNLYSLTTSTPAFYTAIVNFNGNNDTLTGVEVSLGTNPVAGFSIVNNDGCSGTTIQFLSSVSAGSFPFTYSWDFGDGTTSSVQNPTHVFDTTGCGIASFNVTLTVTDANGCTGTTSQVVQIKERPSIVFNDLENPFSEFNNCGNLPSVGNSDFTVRLGLNASSSSCITSFHVDWGDGNIANNLTASSFPLPHTYTQLGAFDITITAVSSNGCTSTRVYKAINQANPAVGISGSGSTTGCGPKGFWFKLSQYELNSPGTRYIWDFGDGSPLVTWEMPILVDSIYHEYNSSSCTSPNTQFTVKVTAKNGCDSTAATINNIRIFTKPEAEFTMPEIGCVNTPIVFNNTSVLSFNSPNCNSTTNFFWDFGDPSSAQNTSSAVNPSHIYSTPGIYSIRLIAEGNCGRDTIIKTICVVPVPTVSFTLDQDVGCGPFIVNATNTSNTITGCAIPQYNWTVTYAAGNCGSGPTWSFANGTTDTSLHPSFQFINAGTYTIRLTISNACTTAFATHTVVVKQPPTVSIPAIQDYCGPTGFSPAAMVENCGSGPLNYLWSFNSGIPSTSTDLSPGLIQFNSGGLNTISLAATNECGTTTATRSFNINPVPVLTIPANQSFCPGETAGPFNFSSSLGGTISWSASSTAIGLNTASGTGNIPSFTTANNSGTAISSTITVTTTVNGCSSQSSFIITVQPSPPAPVVTAVSYCKDETPVALTATALNGYSLLWYTTPSGGTGSSAAPLPTTGTAGITTYYVSQKNDVTGCEGPRSSLVVTVHPSLHNNIIGNAHTICLGQTAQTLTSQQTLTGGNGTYSFQWQSSSDGGITWTNISGANAVNYNPATLSAATSFRRIVVSNGCSDTSTSVLIAVDPAIDNNNIQSSHTICAGEVPDLLIGDVPSGGSGSLFYQWQISQNAISWSNITGATNLNHQHTALSISSYFRRIVISGSCSDTSAHVLVTVNPIPVMNNVMDKIMCNNDASGNILFSSSNIISGVNYSWTNTDASIGLPASGSGNINSFTGINTQLPAVPVSANISVTPEYSNAGKTCIGSPVDFSIIVLPSLSLSPISDTIVCTGSVLPAFVPAHNAGTFTGSSVHFVWTVTGSGIDLSSSSGSQVPSITTTNNGSSDLAAIITITPVYTYNNISCNGEQESYTITVKAATPTASGGPDAILCAAQDYIMQASTSGSGPGTWTLLPGSTTANIQNPSLPNTTITGLLPGNVYQFVWTQSGFASCPSTTDTITIDNKNPLINKIDTSTQTICAGQTVNVNGLAPSGGSGNYIFHWQQSVDGVNFFDINPGGNGQDVSIAPLQTVYLRRHVSAGPCSGYSDTARIIVLPAISNNEIYQDSFVCINTLAPLISGSTPLGGDGNFSYEWEQSTDNLNWNMIPGAINSSYQPGILTQTIFLRRIVASAACASSITSNVITITVRPDAIASFNPPDSTGCPPFNVNAAAIGLTEHPGNNSTYNWYVNGNFIGAGNIFPGYIMNLQDDTILIKLEAISLYGCKNDTLEREFYTYKIPQPAFTISDSVGCGPLTVQFQNTTPDLSAFNYYWDFGNGQTSLLTDPNPVVFPTHPEYIDTIYTVKLHVLSSCDTITFSRNIRVKSKPKALFTPTLTVGCSPMKVIFKNTSKGINNTYYWDFDDGTTQVTTTNDSVQHIFYTGNVDTFFVKLVAVNDCGSDSITYQIIAAPNNINLNFAVNGNQVNGCAPHIPAFINNSSGASTFHWNFGDGNVLSTSSNLDTVYHNYNTPGNYNVSLQATNSCSDTTAYLQINVFAKPDAGFTASNSSICIGESISFQNTSTGGSSYLWHFGDGNTSTLVQPTHIYSGAGIYTVKLLVYNNNAPGNICIDSSMLQVAVSDSLPGFFTQSADTGNCAPFTITFVNQFRPSVTAVWDFGDGNVATGDSVVHSFQSTGTFQVNLTVTMPGGCTYYNEGSVTINGPTGTLQYQAGYVCEDDAVFFQVFASNADSIEWNFGDGNVVTTIQPFVYHNYALPGLYIPTVTLKNNAGCNYPISGIDTIKQDWIDAGFIYSNQQNCGSTVYSFTDTSQLYFGKQEVLWNFGDGVTAAGSSVSHSYFSSGIYNVQMIVKGLSGCSDTVTKQLAVNVNSLPVVSISADTTGCVNEPVLFSANIQSQQPATQIHWQVSDGATAQGNDFVHIFSLPGDYIIRLVAGTAAGCYDTSYHNIKIFPSPVVNTNASMVLCSGNTVQLNVTGATSYQWLPLQGLSCYNCSDPVASPVNTTSYTVEGNNEFGCTDSDTVVITVVQPFTMSVSPDQDICIGSSVNLLANGANTYSWSPALGLSNTNISNPVATPVVTTIYRVIGNDGYNCFSDTAYITVGVGQYPQVNLGPDLVLASGTLHPLHSTFTNGPIASWNWTPATDLSCSACPLPTATIKKDVDYIVTVTNQYGCSGSDTLSIKTFCESSQVFIPNAFTPDNDGVNDILMVRGSGIAIVKSFRIFNRWGQVVFEKHNFPANDPSSGWNGLINGKLPAPDVFVYTAEVICHNGSSFTYKGNVSILK